MDNKTIPTPGALLAGVNSPEDLKKLSPSQLDDFCFELRDFIIDIVSVYGGHFGASLGVVELTTALHYVLETPKDQLVWDVGHQAYGHKIITGRREEFHTNRLYKGVSGFPKRSESVFDTFGVGHSSTSISAALGMSTAASLNNDPKRVVAVIGDGSMSAGMAFEAMNNAGAMNKDVLVILNDNRMSIDPNVGALNEYLADITTSETYNKFRDEIYDMLGHFSKAGEKMRKIAARLERSVAAALTPGSLFRALGFRYFGPVDGHDVQGLVRHLKDLNKIKGPKLLHVVTIKGKGFAPAERDQVKWHASSSPFDKITGEALQKAKPGPKTPKYQDVFAATLDEIAQIDSTATGVTAAMPSGTSLGDLMEKYPNRMFDVGIAEQHAVTFAAGMATQGLKSYVAIYSTFLQRGFDQVVHDVCIQKLPVVFCMDRAGLVGADGPTHHGLYDISYLRSIPNIVLSAPMDATEMRDMMWTAQEYQAGAFAIRYPRGNAVNAPESYRKHSLLEIGKGRVLKEGEKVAVLSYGTIGMEAQKAISNLEEQDIHVGHFDMRFAKPIDEELIQHIISHYDAIITVEDGAKLGGFGSAVAEFVVQQEEMVPVTILGVPDRLIEHGTQAQLYAEVGIDSVSIQQEIERILEKISAKVTVRV